MSPRRPFRNLSLTWPLLALAAAAAAAGGAKVLHSSGRSSMQTLPMQTPPPSAHRFFLEYSTQGGPELGPGLHQTENLLRVDFEARKAGYEVHQPGSEEGGRAIGRFEGALPESLAAKVQSELARVDVSKVGPGNQGGLGTSLLRIVVTQGDQVRQTSFSSRDFAILEKLGPLLEALDGIGSQLRTHPVEALRVQVIRGAPSPAGAVLTLELENIGTAPLRLADPRALPLAGPDSTKDGAAIRIAALPEVPPGYTEPPLVWEYLPLANRPAPAPGPLTLAPGAKARFDTRPWLPRAPDLVHLLQAVWVSYHPVAPGEGPAVLRGRLLSKLVEVEPPKKEH